MVSNADVVRTLERIADLPEIRGENTFKVRAYRLAALQVGNLGRPRRDIAAGEGGLRSVGVFRIDDGARVAGETEDDVYAALGLPWIPPQGRDDPAEIDVVELITAATEV